MSGFKNLSRRMPILIVDGAADTRLAVMNCLREAGFANFCEADNGADALSELKRNEFSLIVSDWNIPQLKGIDLLKAVRADDQLRSIPFLMTTEEASGDKVVLAARAGVSNYIVKPFTTDQLKAKLEAIYATLG